VESRLEESLDHYFLGAIPVLTLGKNANGLMLDLNENHAIIGAI
jgi:hypothetical protein